MLGGEGKGGDERMLNPPIEATFPLSIPVGAENLELLSTPPKIIIPFSPQNRLGSPAFFPPVLPCHPEQSLTTSGM